MMHVSVWFALVTVYFNVKTHDIWEGNMTTRSEIQPKNIHSLEFR
jgi:hypothetical protein